MRARPFLLALALGLAPVAAAGEGAAVLPAAQEPSPAAARFTVAGDRLVYDTETDGDATGIEPGDADALARALRAHPGVTLVEMNSSGGDYFEAFLIADVIADFGLATHVAGSCDSSCAHAFLGGSRRTMARGARIGFHRSTWDAASAEDYYEGVGGEEGWRSPFDMVSWVYEDTQAEVHDRLVFMVDRGVDARFAIDTLRPDATRMWYPSRPRLLAAGYLTD